MIEHTAYISYLLRNAAHYPGQEKQAIAAFIHQDAMIDSNRQAWALLEATGDKGYDMNTFQKAAELVLKSSAQ